MNTLKDLKTGGRARAYQRGGRVAEDLAPKTVATMLQAGPF